MGARASLRTGIGTPGSRPASAARDQPDHLRRPRIGPRRGRRRSRAAVAWATPKQVQDVGAPGLTWADTPSRLVAYILDSFVVAFVAGIVVTVLQIGGPAGTTNTQSSQAISVLTTLLGAAYFIASWSGGRRATPAQRLFNIQVGNAFDGHALTSTQAAKRWLGTGSFLALFGLLPASSDLRPAQPPAAGVGRRPARLDRHESHEARSP